MPTSLLRYFPYLVFFAVLALALCFSIQSNDLFFYLSMGRMFFQHWSLPTTDPFLYIAANWNIYHEWFAYLAFYLSYLIGGFTAIILFKALLWLAVFFCLAREAFRNKVPAAIALSALALTALACTQRFTERGSLFTELFLVGLVSTFLRGPLTRRTLFLIPILFGFWINFHAGFVIGLFVFTAYVILHYRTAPRELWLSLAASYVACLANPDFFVGAIYPLKTALSSDWKYYREFNPEWMSTFKPPFVSTWQVRALMALLLSTSCAFGAWLYKKKAVPLTFCFLFFLYAYLAQNALRFVSTSSVGFTLLLFFAWPHLSESLPSIKQLNRKFNRNFNIVVTALLTILFVLVGARMLARPYGPAISLPEREFGFGVNPSYSPMGATEYIQKNNLQGRIFNQFSWGSYLAWALDRRSFIYIHGHIDEPKLMVVDFIGTANNPVNFQYAVDKYDIKMVLMQKNPPDVLLEIMKSWKLVYQDSLSALWIR